MRCGGQWGARGFLLLTETANAKDMSQGRERGGSAAALRAVDGMRLGKFM
jgi:hypothetical protein